MSSINKLIEIFKRFPTVGSRTAGRFVYYLTKLPKEKIDELVGAITDLKNKIKLCQFCFQPFESDGNLCSICQNPSRNKNLLCVVEKEADLLSIENTKKYNGLYFILDIANPRTEELKKRIKISNFTEIILALNPTPEGRAASSLIEREINPVRNEISNGVKKPPFKITHLARGIPVGGELEYADEETLESALEGRK